MPNPQSIFRPDISSAFAKLSKAERLYAYYMSQAAWACAPIAQQQTSPESRPLFSLIIEIGKSCGCNWEELSRRTGASSIAVETFLIFSARVLSGMGNYEGGGDRKLIPEISTEEFSLICSISPAAQQICEAISDRVFSSEPAALGFPGSGGTCGFYPDSPDIEKFEIEQLQKYLMGNGYLLQNTRLRKTTRENGSVLYQVLVASVNDHAPTLKRGKYDPIEYQSNKTIEFKFGDHSHELKQACIWLKRGLSVAPSDVERRYIEELVNFFESGDIDIDKKACTEWIRNSNPAVEVWIGFLSGYRDPAGVRRSMEGIVAIQDRESSKHINCLVEIAQDLIKLLPWVSSTGTNELGPFELDSYTRPPFLAINMLTVCATQVAIGKAGPTYQDVRDRCGKKNLYFINRAAQVTLEDEIPFVKRDDMDKFKELRHNCFWVIVIVHELIGHGCGKIMRETSPSVFNFDTELPPVNPLSGESIQHWYAYGQDPKSQFGGAYSALNECIAELVSLFLLPRKEILVALGISGDPSDEEVETFEYHGYLLMATMALSGLATYDSNTKKWGQAHAKARFMILRQLVDSGDGALDVKPASHCEVATESHHGAKEQSQDFKITIDKEKLVTSGRRAISDLLLRLHIYKCTGDVETGIPDMERLSVVDGQYLRWKQAVLKCMPPKPLILQANTAIVSKTQDSLTCGELPEVELREYPATIEGFVRSWVERMGDGEL